MSEKLFIYLASILPLGIAAQWLAWRFRMPSILLLLAFGFALGQAFEFTSPGGVDKVLAEALLTGEHSEGEPPGDIQFSPDRLLFPLVSLAVAVILFEGGMTLRLGELKESGRPVLQMCTLGALVAWAGATVAAHFTLGLSWRIACLLGAILVVTGPTVVGPLLRHVRPTRRIGAVAKWEGIVIDPIGAVLAVLVFTALVASGSAGEALGDVVWALVKTIAVGTLIGLATGWLLVQLLDRFLIPDFLQNVFFLAALIGVFAVSNLVQSESGLLTVTVLGFYLANQKTVTVRHVMHFKENLQVLLISTLFIVMSSRIKVSDLMSVGAGGALFLAILILLVRPASVLAGTFGTKLSIRERTFLAFLAPRGIVAAAVASIFALEFAIESGHSTDPTAAAMAEEALRLVPTTFVVIVGTVAVYGLTAGPLARMLGVAGPPPQGILFAGAAPWAVPIAVALQKEKIPVLMIDTNYDHTMNARGAGVPCVYASVLSEYVQEELDLVGLGRMLAITPNDEVNALACQEMTHLFGSKEVYQLYPWDHGEGRRASVSEHLRGRLLFGEETAFNDLARKHAEGFVVKKTALTEEFTYARWRELYGDEAVVLFVLSKIGGLTICTAEDELKPAAGQSLIALVPPGEK